MTGSTFRVLMVCTGNICRSPQAERILDARVASLAGSSESFDVASAGINALSGQPMTGQAVAQALAHGGALREHKARQLTPDMLDDADLIFAMAREHRSWVAQLLPTAAKRTFMLTEFARVLTGCERDAQVGALKPPAAGDWRGWLSLGESRRGYYPPARGENDDVIDPYRRSDRTYAASADRITDAINAITRVIYKEGATVSASELTP